MKRKITLALVLCLACIATQAQEIRAVRDSICINEGERIMYNVMQNDFIEAGVQFPVIQQGESDCFGIDFQGNIFTREGADNCCGEHRLRYFYEGCQEPNTCSAEVIIVVKCPKPDCSVVDLSDYLQGGDPSDGQGRNSCVSTCENSAAVYYVPYDNDSSYDWQVTGGVSAPGSNDAEIVVTWGSTGSGQIVLTIEDGDGNEQQATICVDILPGPTADFAKSADTVCLDQTVYFQNLSSGASSWFWDFGDGMTSNQFNPSHSYNTAGIYEVILSVTRDNFNADGSPSCCCTDTMSMEIVVEPFPGPAIHCISTLCAGDSSKYWTDATNCTNYTWTVLDANDDPVTFTGQGNDTICVYWGDGPYGQLLLDVDNCDSMYCSQPAQALVPIISSVADVNGEDIVCSNSTEVYNAPKWPGVTYDWQISGGAILSGQGTNTVVVQWGGGPGTGTISVNYGSEFLSGLPGQDPAHCMGSGALDVDIRPAFDIIGPATACTGSTSFFSATASPSANYNWTISPAIPFTGQGTNIISVDWTDGPGTYTIMATANDPSAYCNTVVNQIVNVIEVPKPAGIMGDIEICPGGTSTYFGQASAPNVGFQWQVTGGTPTFFNGDPLVVTWNATGPYQISLRQLSLSAPFCPSDTIQLNLQPKQILPPSISGAAACVNETQTYTTSPAQHPDAEFLWTIAPIDAGSVVGGQGTPSAMIQWNNTPGPVTVGLDVSLCGQTQSTSITYTLNAVATPDIMQLDDLCPGGSATLDAGSGYSSYLWSTGATTQTISISTADNYLVTVTDANGCTAIDNLEVFALDGPVASISTSDPRVLCSNPPNNTGSVTITALTGAGYTYAWYCNGILQALPSTQNFLLHNNTMTPATFNYWVIIMDPDGCTNQSNTITVTQSECTETGPGCRAEDYTLAATAANQMPDCNVVDFSTTTTPNVTITGWNFDDPANNINSGTLSNAQHTYSQAGCYLVRVLATVPSLDTPPGICAVESTVEVCIPLAADFSFSSSCLVVDFCDQSTFRPGEGPVTWMWNFGDGNTGTGDKPSHTYANGGNYTVMLTATNANGCSATYNETITIAGLPNPNPTATPDPACVDAPVQFNSGGSGIVSWLWDFGDFTTNGAQNPQHTYLSPGSYTVSLTVVDEFGCSNTATLPLVVNPAPPADTIAWAPSLELCDGDQVTLTAPAGAGYTYLWSTGATTASITTGTAGVYHVTVTDANDCELIPDPVTVTVYPLPPSTISGPQVICGAACINLNAPLGFGYTYEWLEDGGTPIPGANSPSLEVCHNTVQSPYLVIVTDANGCSATSDPFEVNTAIPPAFNITAMPDSCEGTLSTLDIVPIQTDVVYTWSTSETGVSIDVLQAGTYSATGTDTLTGCSHTATITIHPLPDLCLVPVGCYEVCNPDTICGPAGLAAYQWNLDGVPISGATEECLIVTSSGSYSLTGTTEFGCSLTSDSLMLTVLDCGCDNLALTPVASPTDSCCWSLDYQNDYTDDLYGFELTVDGANLNLGAIDPALMLVSSTTQTAGFTGAGGTLLPVGDISSAIDFCFTDVTQSPQELIIDWYDPLLEIVCSDTLYFECPVEPDCLYLQADSIYCEDGIVLYEMTVCNPIDAAFPVGWIDIVASTPPGILPMPPFFDLSADPILAGECRDFTITLLGDDIAGEEFCYNLLAHQMEPTADTVLCCSLDTMYCISIPDCDPCDNIGVEGVEPLQEDDGLCCYNITLFNNYDIGVFDGIGICTLDPSNSLSMYNPFGSGWTTTNYTPNAINLAVSPPIGTSLPLGTFTLPELCVETNSAPPQLLEIKWLNGDSVICRDTINVFCEPPCGYIERERIACDEENGGWRYRGIIKNTSDFVVGEANIVITSPPGMSGYNITRTFGGGLAPGGTGSFVLNLGPPAMPGDTLCFTVALHEEDDDDNHTNCCNFEHCVILPDCDPEPICNCDDAFTMEALMGFNCSPGSGPGIYEFTPVGDLGPCDMITWYIDGSTDIEPIDVIGQTPAVFTLPDGIHKLCMKVFRIASNGEECGENYCGEFNTDNCPIAIQQSQQTPQIPWLQPTPEEEEGTVPAHAAYSAPIVYPNPSSGHLFLRFDESAAKAVQVVVTDVFGRTQQLQYFDEVQAGAALPITTEHLPSGLYWIKIDNGQQQHVEKVIIE